MTIALLLLAPAAAATAHLVPAGVVVLASREVRLGDVVRSRSGELADGSIARRVIARVPAAVRSVTLSRVALARLARRHAPGLGLEGGRASGEVTFRFQAVSTPDSANGCRVLTQSARRGKVVDAAFTRAADCRDAQMARVIFDPGMGMAVAAEDLSAGAYLGRLALRPAPAVHKGAKLRLVSTVGPVRVERRVTAMQPGRAARRMFVQDNEGQVFAVRVAVKDAAR